jgi:outer membrane protein OmpA-like peptidoglycan-associated protein
MPPLLTEEDLNAALSAAKDESSLPTSEGGRPLSAEERIDQMHRDVAELMGQVFRLRNDLARSSASLKKTVIITGISVACLIALGATALSSAVDVAGDSGTSSGKSVTGQSSEMEGVLTATKNINNRLGRQPYKLSEVAKAVDKLDCARLPPQIKATAVDFSIQFQVGSAEILPASQGTLDAIGKVLALAPDRCILVEGHTDATGKAERNLALSKDRANSVANYIAEKAGIDRRMLVPVGKGSSSPATGFEPRDPQNRRVVFKVVTG